MGDKGWSFYTIYCEKSGWNREISQWKKEIMIMNEQIS